MRGVASHTVFRRTRQVASHTGYFADATRRVPTVLILFRDDPSVVVEIEWTEEEFRATRLLIGMRDKV